MSSRKLAWIWFWLSVIIVIPFVVGSAEGKGKTSEASEAELDIEIVLGVGENAPNLSQLLSKAAQPEVQAEYVVIKEAAARLK